MLPCFLTGVSSGLRLRPGIFYATILVSSVTDGHIYWWRTSQPQSLKENHKTQIWQDFQEILWSSGHSVMEAEISVRPGHNIDIMSSCTLSSHWSPPLILASHWPVLVFAASARYARYDLRHVSYASCSRSLDIIGPEINSIRTQPETFSFTLLTCGGFKLKSWFLTLGWWKQF